MLPSELPDLPQQALEARGFFRVDLRGLHPECWGGHGGEGGLVGLGELLCHPRDGVVDLGSVVGVVAVHCPCELTRLAVGLDGNEVDAVLHVDVGGEVSPLLPLLGLVALWKGLVTCGEVLSHDAAHGRCEGSIGHGVHAGGVRPDVGRGVASAHCGQVRHDAVRRSSRNAGVLCTGRVGWGNGILGALGFHQLRVRQSPPAQDDALVEPREGDLVQREREGEVQPTACELGRVGHFPVDVVHAVYQEPVLLERFRAVERREEGRKGRDQDVVQCVEVGVVCQRGVGARVLHLENVQGGVLCGGDLQVAGGWRGFLRAEEVVDGQDPGVQPALVWGGALVHVPYDSTHEDILGVVCRPPAQGPVGDR